MTAKVVCASCGTAVGGAHARWCGDCGASLDGPERVTSARPAPERGLRRPTPRPPLTLIVVLAAVALTLVAVAVTGPVSPPSLDVEVVDDGPVALPAAPERAWVNPCRVGRDRPCGVPVATDLPRGTAVWPLQEGREVLTLTPAGTVTLTGAPERPQWRAEAVLPETASGSGHAPTPADAAVAEMDDLVVVSAAGRTVGLERADGSLRWEVELAPPSETLTTVAPGRDGTLYLAAGSVGAAVDPTTGRLLFSQSGSAPTTATPHGVVVVRGHRAALLTADEQPRWEADLPPDVRLWDSGFGRAVVRRRGAPPQQPVDGPIVLGDLEKVVLAPADGALLLGAEEIVEAGVAVDGGAFAAVRDVGAPVDDEVERTLIALANDGSTRWSQPLADVCCPTVLSVLPDAGLLVSTWHVGGHPALVLDPDTGDTVDELLPPLEVMVGSPRIPIVAVSDTVAVWQVSNRLIGVDRASGDEVWRVIGDAASPARVRSMDPLIVVAQHQVVRLDRNRP